MKGRKCLFVVFLGIALAATTTQAGLIGVVMDYPQLLTWYPDVTYTAGGVGEYGTLVVQDCFWGFQTYAADSTPGGELFCMGTFLLTASIDKDKATPESVGGSLSITSDYSGFSETVASSTDLGTFGFGGDGLFDFWFDTGTGPFVTYTGGFGVIVAAPGLGTPSFQEDFSISGMKAEIPEPVTMVLLAFGAIGALRRRR